MLRKKIAISAVLPQPLAPVLRRLSEAIRLKDAQHIEIYAEEICTDLLLAGQKGHAGGRKLSVFSEIMALAQQREVDFENIENRFRKLLQREYFGSKGDDYLKDIAALTVMAEELSLLREQFIAGNYYSGDDKEIHDLLRNISIAVSELSTLVAPRPFSTVLQELDASDYANMLSAARRMVVTSATVRASGEKRERLFIAVDRVMDDLLLIIVIGHRYLDLRSLGGQQRPR